MKQTLLMLGVLMALSFAGCTDKEEVEPTLTPLTENEKADLLFLREEEKLARDVYLYASDKYGKQIFSNISSSEQKHMNEVLTLLQKYEVTDPASSDTGVFRNTELQQLYTALTAKTDLSLADALEVGATIEDLDIHDIDENLSRTIKDDLTSLYDKLQCGSRNHMRAYYGQLSDEGVTYVPKYISQTRLDEILARSHENCSSL